MSDLFVARLLSRRALSTFSKSISFTVYLVALCALLAGTVATGQTVSGTVSGTVVDSSGALIPGASVTLVDQRSGSVRTLPTNGEGRFVFSAVQPEIYTIKISSPGFETLVQQNVVLSANENLALGKLELKAGQSTETVTVIAGGGKVETESSDLSARLTSDQISLISTKGRDVTSLLRLLPGTSYIDDIEAVGEGFGTDLPNISGQRGRSTVATVDGLNASEPSGSNKISMSTNQDAIAEVKVLRNNYAAEYGNNGGAMINIVTKNGGQSYHGSGYYYLRNEALNANDWFNNNTGLKRPLYRHNIWGVNLGGPVQIPKLFPNPNRQRLFFFYSYEKPHTITPQNPRLVTVPTALERQGDFSQTFDSKGKLIQIKDPLTGNAFSGNKIPANRLNASGLKILNFYPLPNATNVPSCPQCNYVIQKSVDVPKWSQVIRFDFKPSDYDSFNLKGQWWTSDNEGFGTSGWPGTANGFTEDVNRWNISSHYLYKDDGATAGWTHIFTPRVVNEITVGVRHDSEGFIPSTGEANRLSRQTIGWNVPQLFSGTNKLGLIPRVTDWRGVGGQPANINWLDRWGETGNDYIVPSVSDNLSINRGVHSFKVGTYFERVRNGEAPGGNWTGTYTFRSNDSTFTTALGNTGYAYANAALGNFNSYSESTSRPHANLEIMLLQWYAQDSWKVSRSFTLNYGLRMGYHTQQFPRDRLASNFDPARFDPAKAQVLYQPFCVGGTPALGTACSTTNQRARNPLTGELKDPVLVGSFVPGVGDRLNGIALQSDPSTPAGFKKVQPIDFEPRIGFAWDISGAGKTVLRAMGGVYHAARAGGGTTGGNLVSNAPFQRTVTINFNNAPNQNSIDQIATLANACNKEGSTVCLNKPTSLNGIEVNSNTPTIYNYSLGIQQDLGFKTTMEITYVGSVSRHLGEKRNINGVPDGARFVDLHPENRNPFSNSKTSAAKADDFLRPYQGWSDINIVSYTGTSNYNSLQVQVNRRYTKGFQYGVAYTWSKSLDYSKDDDSGDVFLSRPYRLFNYGPSDFDQTHIFTANYIWDVPSPGNGFLRSVFGNWQASGTTSLVSGKPKSVSVDYNAPSGTGLSTDLTGGEVNARPSLICDPNQGATGSTTTGVPIVINTSCFAMPSRFDIGNAHRNLIRLPGIITTDLAVFKNFHVTERHTLRFGWEVYNLFNHTNFKDIDAKAVFDVSNGSQTSTTFGTPTTARSPRVMQGSLRFSF